MLSVTSPGPHLPFLMSCAHFVILYDPGVSFQHISPKPLALLFLIWVLCSSFLEFELNDDVSFHFQIQSESEPFLHFFRGI